MVANCVRLSNDSKFFISSCNINTNNTYSEIINENVNIRDSAAYNIYIPFKPVIRIVYNSRNELLTMKSDVIKSFKRLKEIEQLGTDWNGYGAKPFSETLISKCKRIVSLLSIQPSIYPTGRNSIQFQYELSDRSYLEFEIFENKTMCLQVPERIYSRAVECELVDSEDEKIKEMVDNFYGRNGTEK